MSRVKLSLTISGQGAQEYSGDAVPLVIQRLLHLAPNSVIESDGIVTNTPNSVKAEVFAIANSESERDAVILENDINAFNGLGVVYKGSEPDPLPNF